MAAQLPSDCQFREICENHEVFKQVIEAAAERGAKTALAKIGLADEQAGQDVRDLRALMRDWRGIRKTVTRTIAQAITMAILGALAAGMVFKFGGPPE